MVWIDSWVVGCGKDTSQMTISKAVRGPAFNLLSVSTIKDPRQNEVRYFATHGKNCEEAARQQGRTGATTHYVTGTVDSIQICMIVFT